MNFKFQISNFQFPIEKIVATLIFVVLGLIALQIPFSQLAGSRVQFTLFDLFAPISGAFLGGGLGIVSVLAMQIVNWAMHGFAVLDKGTIIRLFPILFGVLFFARSVKKDSLWLLLIPLAAIVSWNLNPIGRSVWYYSLFWTIPALVYPVVKRSLVARSLASTFVAHSVGGAVWIWAFSLPATVWQGLIPVVALERSIMALGIAASYILINNVAFLVSRQINVSLNFDKKAIHKLFR